MHFSPPPTAVSSVDQGDIIDLMNRTWRRAETVVVGVAAVILVGVGALVSRILRRRTFVWARADSSELEPTLPERTEPKLASVQAAAVDAPPSPLSQDGQASEEGSADNSRGRSFVRRGFTTTVKVLLVLAIGTAAFAFYLRPTSGVPQPAASELDLTFGPAHHARSLIKVDLTLAEDAFVAPGPPTAASLIIYLAGPDLTRPGWELLAHVPSGVQIGTLTDNPHALHITRASGEDTVYARPGAVRRGSFLAELRWYNLDSAPLEVQGANLAAEFPLLSVMNQSSRGGLISSLPTPSVSLSRHLEPEGDYAYLAGLPPDHQGPGQPPFTWSWNPETIPGGGGSTVAWPMTVEARSATADERAHAAEFQSGILFGVAAAALIAAIQEFVNAGRKLEGGQAGQSST